VQLQLLDTPRNIEDSIIPLKQDADSQDLYEGREEVLSSASPHNQDAGSQPVVQPKHLDRPASVVDSSSSQR